MHWRLEQDVATTSSIQKLAAEAIALTSLGSSTKMAKKVATRSNWICTRTFVLKEGKSQRKVIGKIGQPMRRGKTWVCPITVSGIGLKGRIDAVGEDQMQALVLALEGMRTVLLKNNAEWRWVYGEKGDLGIPRSVPTGFGIEFAHRIESMIDDEVAKFAAAAEERHNRNTKPRKNG
jgi:hypothetical protein